MSPELDLKPSFAPYRKWGIGLHVAFVLLVVLAVVGMINYVSHDYFLRLHLSTRNKINLSPRTVKFLEGMTNQVKVTVYYDKDEPFFNTIIDLLNEYRRRNAGITTRIVDYKRDPGSAQQLKAKYTFLTAPTAKNLIIFDCEHGGVKPLDGNALTIDPLFDVHETTAIVQAATRNGVIILGGGSPKNFYLQGQPTLWEVYGILKGGNDYFIQITQDAPHWGGLSGATPSEAVSWGKIKPEQLDESVVVYADTTVAFPLIAAYAVSRAAPRPRRELYTRREEMMSELRAAYQRGAAQTHTAEATHSEDDGVEQATIDRDR